MASQTNIAWGCGVDTGRGACSPPSGHDLSLAKFIPSTDSITLLFRPRYIARERRLIVGCGWVQLVFGWWLMAVVVVDSVLML